MSNPNKIKGDRFEWDLVNFAEGLLADSDLTVERTRAGYARDYGDILIKTPDDRILGTVQAKNRRERKWSEWLESTLRQATEVHARFAALIVKRIGVADVGRSYAIMPADMWLRLLATLAERERRAGRAAHRVDQAAGRAAHRRVTGRLGHRGRSADPPAADRRAARRPGRAGRRARHGARRAGVPVICAVCLFVREQPDEAVTIMGGYAVCRRHSTVITATLGTEWAAILVIAGLPAREAQNNPRPLPPLDSEV